MEISENGLVGVIPTFVRPAANLTKNKLKRRLFFAALIAEKIMKF